MADPKFSDDSLDDGEGGGQPNGKGLRAQLESALEMNKSFEKELRTYKVKEILTEKGYRLVKAEDLAEVPLDKVAERAESLEKDRSELQRTLLADVLGRQGIEGDELEEALNDFLGAKAPEKPADEDDDADEIRLARSLGGVAGAASQRVDVSKLSTDEKLELGLKQAAQQKKRR